MPSLVHQTLHVLCVRHQQRRLRCPEPKQRQHAGAPLLVPRRASFEHCIACSQSTGLFASLTRPCLARGCYSGNSGCFRTAAAHLSDGSASKAAPPWWIATTSLALAGLPRCWRARASSRPHLVWRAMAEPISPRSRPYPPGLRSAIPSTLARQHRRAGATVQLAGPGVTPHAPQRRTALAAELPPGPARVAWRWGRLGGRGGSGGGRGSGDALLARTRRCAAPRPGVPGHPFVAVYYTHTHTLSMCCIRRFMPQGLTALVAPPPERPASTVGRRPCTSARQGSACTACQ